MIIKYNQKRSSRRWGVHCIGRIREGEGVRVWGIVGEGKGQILSVRDTVGNIHVSEVEDTYDAVM